MKSKFCEGIVIFILKSDKQRKNGKKIKETLWSIISFLSETKQMEIDEFHCNVSIMILHRMFPKIQ